eukprot:524750_1
MGKNCLNMLASTIIFYVILVVFATVNMVLSMYNIYKLYREKRKFITIQILFFIINIFFGFGGIAYSIHLSFGFVYISSKANAWDSLGLTGLNCYFYGLALLYLLYFLRLWMICNATTLLTLSKIIIVTCSIAFILQISMTPLATYYFVMLEWNKAIMFMTLFTFFNTIFSLYLLSIFWIKIYKLGHTLESQQAINRMKVLSPGIRYAFCALISIISSQFVNFVSIYRAYINDNEFWWSIHLTFIVMDESINLLCLFLQFSFGKKYYFKYLGFIHLRIEKKFIKQMSPSLILQPTDHDKVNSFSTANMTTINVSDTTTTSDTTYDFATCTTIPKLNKSVTTFDAHVIYN